VGHHRRVGGEEVAGIGVPGHQAQGASLHICR
jgi:hypothetical protein